MITRRNGEAIIRDELTVCRWGGAYFGGKGDEVIFILHRVLSFSFCFRGYSLKLQKEVKGFLLVVKLKFFLV